MEKKYTYIVTENAKTKHSDETFDVIGNFKTKKSAIKFIKEYVDSVKRTWDDIIDDSWDEEINEDSYELYDGDYEYFYKVEIHKKEIKE